MFAKSEGKSRSMVVNKMYDEKIKTLENEIQKKVSSQKEKQSTIKRSQSCCDIIIFQISILERYFERYQKSFERISRKRIGIIAEK